MIIGRDGEVHSLSHRVRGATTCDIRARLKDVDLQSLPSVADTKCTFDGPCGVAMCGHYADALREGTGGQGTRSSRVAMTPHSSRTAGRTRAILTAMVEPLASPRILRPARVPARRFLPARRRFHSLRAILIGAFAAKLADLQHTVPDHELK